LWKLIEKDLDKVIDKLKIREPKEKFGFVRLRVLGFCGRLVRRQAPRPTTVCARVVCASHACVVCRVSCVVCRVSCVVCRVQVAQSANPQNIGFIHAMTKLNFWSVILDLFFTFVWNNFVHNVVERILAVALTNPLLREFKLTVPLSFPSSPPSHHP
jgi:hypothetical protein